MTTQARKIGRQSDRSGPEDHQGLVLPFIEISGRWHVVLGWEPGMIAGEILELRPLSQQESDWLEPELENAVMEVWARLFRDDYAIKNGAKPPNE